MPNNTNIVRKVQVRRDFISPEAPHPGRVPLVTTGVVPLSMALSKLPVPPESRTFRVPVLTGSHRTIAMIRETDREPVTSRYT